MRGLKKWLGLGPLSMSQSWTPVLVQSGWLQMHTNGKTASAGFVCFGLYQFTLATRKPAKDSRRFCIVSLFQRCSPIPACWNFWRDTDKSTETSTPSTWVSKTRERICQKKGVVAMLANSDFVLYFWKAHESLALLLSKQEHGAKG